MSQKRWLAVRLRHKLLLVYLALLIIPWAGYQSIAETETFLRQSRESTLAATARATAALMRQHAAVFRQGERKVDEQRDIYSHHLQTDIRLDGSTRDWQPYWERVRKFSAKNALLSGDPATEASGTARVLFGRRGPFLYMVFDVEDDRLLWCPPQTVSGRWPCDHIRVGLITRQQYFRQFVFAATGEGEFKALRREVDDVVDDAEPQVRYKRDITIKSFWRKSEQGYVVEIRLPVSLVGDRLGFAIADVDAVDSPPRLIGSSHTEVKTDLGHILLPSYEIEQSLKPVTQNLNRTWVVNRHGRVMAISGSLIQQKQEWNEADNPSLITEILRVFYSWILPDPAEEFQDDLFGAARLEGREIIAALQGSAMTRWRASPDEQVAILAATHPVSIDDKIVGAVVVEETNSAILSLQNKALERFFSMGSVAITAAMLVMVWFASRLTGRIRRLKQQVDQSFSPDGKVVGGVDKTRIGDELGDLRRSFSDIVERLKQYTRYLETMAGKLSHELRTPLAVVKSSLENMEDTGIKADSKVYLDRAKDGIKRLNHILTGLSEATRLEQSFKKTEKEPFDLAHVIPGCVEGYKSAYPKNRFECNVSAEGMKIEGAPELIAQLLDKLVSNAVGFTEKQNPIIIGLDKQSPWATVTVGNSGPLLPEEMKHQLFDSMVSVRKTKSDTPHLGLGLYIVRLITDYHHGRVQANNREDGSGVEFKLQLPLVETED